MASTIARHGHKFSAIGLLSEHGQNMSSNHSAGASAAAPASCVSGTWPPPDGADSAGGAID